MKVTLISLALLFSAGLVSATPAGDKPKPPPKPTPTKPSTTVVNQVNQCGNGNNPYCCAADGKGGYSNCYAMSGSSQCSFTIVCCNANDSNQYCMGSSVTIHDGPWW